MTFKSHFKKTCPVPSKPSSRILFLLHRNLARLGFFFYSFCFQGNVVVYYIHNFSQKSWGPESFILLSTESGVVLSHVEFQLLSEWEEARVIKYYTQQQNKNEGECIRCVHILTVGFSHTLICTSNAAQPSSPEEAGQEECLNGQATASHAG